MLLPAIGFWYFWFSLVLNLCIGASKKRWRVGAKSIIPSFVYLFWFVNVILALLILAAAPLYLLNPEWGEVTNKVIFFGCICLGGLYAWVAYSVEHRVESIFERDNVLTCKADDEHILEIHFAPSFYSQSFVYERLKKDLQAREKESQRYMNTSKDFKNGGELFYLYAIDTLDGWTFEYLPLNKPVLPSFLHTVIFVGLVRQSIGDKTKVHRDELEQNLLTLIPDSYDYSNVDFENWKSMLEERSTVLDKFIASHKWWKQQQESINKSFLKQLSEP